MSLGITPAQLERFLAMEPDEQAARIAAMSFTDMLDFDAAFEMWAHDSQLPPPGEGWRVWLMMAGRGFGKTRAGAEWIHKLAQSGQRRIALVGATIDEARTVMVEGVSGLLTIARNNRVRLKWEPSLNRLTWPGGSVATLFSGDSPDGLRGPEHHFAWCVGADFDAALSRRGRRSAGRSAAKSGERQLLPDRHRRHRRLVGRGPCNRLLHGRWLAICRADRRG